MKLIYVFLTGTPVLFLVYFVFRRRAQQSQPDGEERGLRVMVFVVSLLWGFAWTSQKQKNTLNLVHLQEPTHA